MRIEHAIDEYLSHLRIERGSSPLTIEAYAADLADYLSFLDEDDTAEYSKKNLEYFLRQTTYEFVSAEMWDEDNTMEYEYGQRVHKKRVLHAPGGDVLAVVEVACEETW